MINLENLAPLGTLASSVLYFLLFMVALRLAVTLFVMFAKGFSFLKDDPATDHKTTFGQQQENDSPIIVEEMVYDKICGRPIPRRNSYIVATDDGYHYFCSWDCREKFVENLG